MVNDYEMTISAHRELAPGIWRLELQGDFDYAGALPGTFVEVEMPDEAYQLRRPFAIADCDSERQTLALIYRVVGAGTELMSQLHEGATLKLLGSLGNGFPFVDLAPGQRTLLVGGGTGIPPLLYLSKVLHERGIQADIAVGFLNQKSMFATDELQQYGNLAITTNDGSVGIKGFVSAVLDNEWHDNHYDRIYACGPLGLLMSVQNRYPDADNVYLSLESRMACGVGACEGCVVPDKQGKLSLRVCVEGPVFNSQEVQLSV